MTSSTRIDRPQHDDGPFPATRWVREREYFDAFELCWKIATGTRYRNVQLTFDPNPSWQDWAFLELPELHRPDRTIVTALPLQDGPWGEASTSAFLWVVAAQTEPETQEKKTAAPGACDGDQEAARREGDGGEL